MKIKPFITFALINSLIVTGILLYLGIIRPEAAGKSAADKMAVPFITPAPVLKTTPNMTSDLKTDIIPTDTPESSPKTVPDLNNRCIISVRGSKFDITDFKKIHSGGDIFQCGTDMTDIFNGRHGDREFQILGKYQI